VRIVPKGTGRVEREAWVRGQLRKQSDAPTLAEVAITEVSIAQSADVVSMAELPGSTLFATSRTSFEPEVQALYEQFGAGLASIHNVRVEGFGLIDAGGRGAFPTWRAAFDALAAAGLEEARVSPLSDLVTAARDVITALTASLDESIEASLVHGDAQPMNVQVHRGKIIAFIDFEFASGADPSYELAYVEPLFEPSPLHPALTPDDLAARRAAFYKGYARHRPVPVPDSNRTRLYRLVHALRGTEFLSVVGPQLAAPERAEKTVGMRAALQRWL
jgi:aminoglycoside phosphotransferase (APT) family kinase protein